MSHRVISPEIARRLAIYRQRLAGERPAPTAEGILDVVRDLGCLQLDPISAVARSHTLVTFSRVGVYPLRELDKLLWEDRTLFEYWAHVASIVLTEDYPIHGARMRQYVTDDGEWAQRVREWVALNQPLHDYILNALRENGAMLSRELEADGHHPQEWVSSGWTSGRNVSRMLDYLWSCGVITVAGRKGGQKVWDLSERFFPEWTPRDELTPREVTTIAAQKALRALGVAKPQHIKVHYTRGRYPHLTEVLNELEAAGTIARVTVKGSDGAWSGVWYVHSADLPLIDRLEAGEWQPRTVLLSPFDNLICDRARTELMFDFNFRIEIYVPAAKRQYGYYVLPILHGDRLIGRIDPTYQRKTGTLAINAVYAEDNAPSDDQTARAVRCAIEELATFLGAKQIDYGERLPDFWRRGLTAS